MSDKYGCFDPTMTEQTKTPETDRELLEAAAKAAGYVRVGIAGDGTSLFLAGVKQRWNPLTDDGDALRLACKLSISIDHNRAADQQRYVVAERPGCEGCFAPVCAVEDDLEDESHRAAATRRAIVRAAAEIGAMTEAGR